MTAPYVLTGDCLAVMPTLEAASVDAIVTDPPYGLRFMGKDWDHGIPGAHFWIEALRVAKPGAHLLAFGGTRTHHRLMVAIEDAGWEIRDCLMWLYGTGFPKSLDVSKAIDKAAGADREVVGFRAPTGSAIAGNAPADSSGSHIWSGKLRATAPITEMAVKWAGWGTALKPAWEPIILARKPLAGTVAANATAHGTGGLNINGCRLWAAPGDEPTTADRIRGNRSRENYRTGTTANSRPALVGRWPANILLGCSCPTVDDAAAELARMVGGEAEGYGLWRDWLAAKGLREQHRPDCPVALLDVQSGLLSAGGYPAVRNTSGYSGGLEQGPTPHGARATDAGGASRFFYCAKASRSEREAGITGPRRPGGSNIGGYVAEVAAGLDRNRPVLNHHPTVKPIALMRWLCRLITPPGGLILDPFAGSGSTGCAAVAGGFRFLGIEQNPEYAAIAERRILHHIPTQHGLGL